MTIPRRAGPDGRRGYAFLDWAHRHRTAVASAAHAAIASLSIATAYLLIFEFDLASVAMADFARAAGVLVVIRLTVNYWFGLTARRWRFIGSRDFLRLSLTQTVGSLAFFAVTWSPWYTGVVPRSVIVVEWALSGYMTMITWVGYRIAFERIRRRQGPEARRVLLLGAGEAGEALVGQMLRSPWGYRPVALLDDDPFKWGTSIHGLEVVGATRLAAEVVRDLNVDEIVLSMPSADASVIRRVVEACEATNVPIKILPGVDEVLDGSVSPGMLREVEIEDLLGREPVTLELPALAEDLRGKTVLVTGAAGSIGSELVRQIALHAPGTLVLLDQAETPLYYLDLEVRRQRPDLRVVPVVGSVTDRETMAGVMSKFRPARVFHAAAYKHVPLMEEHPAEAARTNVLGTYVVASAAARSGCEFVLLVSTDKAVYPANVMGATKMLAEQVMLELQSEYPDTGFGAVRFGNVLGSNGSVVPLFKQQLARGEPLTVTDEAVTRYFMTIPEAVQLILQASLLPDLKGRIAMLDMGEPVRILDLARDMLRLSGVPYRPGVNVVITGLRPGEKLHEELSRPDELAVPTSVPRVSILAAAPGAPRLAPELVGALEHGDVSKIVSFVRAVRAEPDQSVPAVGRPRLDLVTDGAV